MGTKVKDFIAALESGETRESARDIAGCSDATSRIQFAKWNKGKKGGSPIPGKALPKKSAKVKDDPLETV